jgi:hypothetical protein
LAQGSPPQATTQQSKVVHAGPPQQETQLKTSSPEADYSDDDVTFDGFSKKDGGDDFGEELEESTYADKHQHQHEEKKQAVSNQMDQDDGKTAKEFDSGINNQDLRTLSFESCCVYRNRMETAVQRIVIWDLCFEALRLKNEKGRLELSMRGLLPLLVKIYSIQCNCEPLS